MAIIIPPEFYGFFGLGQSLQGIGQEFEERRLQGRREEQEDEQSALNRMIALQKAFPNDPSVWMAPATEAGLIPAGTVRTPTFGENVQEILNSANDKIASGLSFEDLEPIEQLAYGQQFELRPGQTPETAKQAEALALNRANLELAEAQRATVYAESFDAYLANPEVRERLGLSEGANRGTLEGLTAVSGITSQRLADELTRARTDTERRQLALINARIKQYEREALEIAGDTPQGKWLFNLAEITGYSPNALSAAFDPESSLSEEHRARILDTVEQHRRAIIGDFQKRIRAGEGGSAVQSLINITELMEAGVDFGLEQNDPFFRRLKENALLEMGVPAHFIEAAPSFWRDDPSFTLQPGEAPPTEAQEATSLVGGGELPTISEEEAAIRSTRLIVKHGSIDRALEAVNKSGAIEADKKVLRTSLEAARQTDTPEPEVRDTGDPEVQPVPPLTREQTLAVLRLGLGRGTERQYTLDVPLEQLTKRVIAGTSSMNDLRTMIAGLIARGDEMREEWERIEASVDDPSSLNSIQLERFERLRDGVALANNLRTIMNEGVVP